MRAVRSVCFLAYYSCATNVHSFTPSESILSEVLSLQFHQRRRHRHRRRRGCGCVSKTKVLEHQTRHHCSFGFPTESIHLKTFIPCLLSRFSSADDNDNVLSRGTDDNRQRISPDTSIVSSTTGGIPSSTRRRQQQQQPQRQRWVLLVDDESAIRQAVGQLLIESNFRVTACQNGQEAWQIIGGGQEANEGIRENATLWPSPALPASNATDTDTTTSTTPAMESTQFGSLFDPNQPLQYTTTPPPVPVVANYGAVGRMLPDVVVSDVHMPVMDGLTLLSTIRSSERVAHIPVVLLTVRAGPADRVAGYSAGADAYLPKPFDPDELVTLLHNVVNRHEQMYTTRTIDSDDSGSSSSSSSSSLLGELKRDVLEIQDWIMQRGGGGSGQPGWVAVTDVFLAPDERQILTLLCDGLLNKEIAERTYLSTRRVEQLLTNMYRKTKVKNRTELVRWAIATGTVKL